MVIRPVLQLAIRPGSPESLQQLIEIARSNFKNAASFAAMKDEKVRHATDNKVWMFMHGHKFLCSCRYICFLT